MTRVHYSELRFLLILLLLCMASHGLHAQDQRIFGIWKTTNTKIEIYNSDGFQGIVFDGYINLITKIEGSYPSLLMNIEDWTGEDSKGNRTGLTRGLVRMTFLSDERMWFEVVPGPETDDTFPRTDYVGRLRVFIKEK